MPIINYALIGAEPDRIAEKPRHCAELAAVRATASRLNRNNAKRLPSAAYALKHRRQEVGDDLEQEYARSPALLKMLGRAFGFGAAGKLERARFKVSYKREQLAEFESLHLDGRPER